jgi:hypothetical protein
MQLHFRKVTISQVLTHHRPAAITSFPSLPADPLGCYTRTWEETERKKDPDLYTLLQPHKSHIWLGPLKGDLSVDQSHGKLHHQWYVVKLHDDAIWTGLRSNKRYSSWLWEAMLPKLQSSVALRHCPFTLPFAFGCSANKYDSAQDAVQIRVYHRVNVQVNLQVHGCKYPSEPPVSLNPNFQAHSRICRW